MLPRVLLEIHIAGIAKNGFQEHGEKLQMHPDKSSTELKK